MRPVPQERPLRQERPLPQGRPLPRERPRRPALRHALPAAPGFRDEGGATVLELQKPRLPPTQTPLSVDVLPSTMRPSLVRGAGWLRGACARFGVCCACAPILEPPTTATDAMSAIRIRSFMRRIVTPPCPAEIAAIARFTAC